MLNTSPIVLFGGAFNPPHKGHLEPIQRLAENLDFAEVRLLPSPSPPHKQIQSVDLKHRTEMARIACEHYDRLCIDESESELPSPTFTVQTLAHFRQRFPNESIVFVIGMDSLLSINTWIRWGEILTFCHLLVLPRPDFNIQPNTCIQEWLKNHVSEDWSELRSSPCGRVFFADTPLWPISSSELRDEISQHKQTKLTEWLVEPVINYIDKYQLYVNQDEENS